MSDYSAQGKENLDVMHMSVNYNQKIFNFLNYEVTSDTKILDFGAGFGEFCNRFDGNNIKAVEVDEKMHKFILCPSFCSLDEINNELDMIYSSNVLEHIKDDKEIVNKFYQHLGKGGSVRVFLPAKMSLFSKMDEVVGHYRRYERESLIALFEETGFKVNYCYYFDSLGFFSSWVYNKINQTGVVDKRSIVFYDKFLFPISVLMDKIGFKHVVGRNLLLEAHK